MLQQQGAISPAKRQYGFCKGSTGKNIYTVAYEVGVKIDPQAVKNRQGHLPSQKIFIEAKGHI